MKKIIEWIKTKLNIRSVRRSAYVSEVIKFGEVNSNGILFDKDMRIEVNGKIKDFVIDERGVKVIKSFDFEGISFTNSKRA